MYVKDMTLTFDQVNELIAYDGQTGIFTWRKAPSRRHKVGSEVGEVKSRLDKRSGVSRSYKYIGLLYHQTPAARIAWLLTHGEWPKGNIQFKDGDTLNLKIDNLKEGDFPAIVNVTGARRTYKMTREAQRHYALQQNYGISLETYNVMLAAQNGVCDICHGTETYVPKNQTEVKPLSVDHNHETGAIRGLLCSNCNYIVGHCKEDREILLAAIKYLDKHEGTDRPMAKLEIVRTAPSEETK
jgi:Recombination endonuclease VII/HNH endonuclease